MTKNGPPGEPRPALLGVALALLLAGPAIAQTAIPRVHGGRSLVLVRGDRPAEVDDPSDVAAMPDGGILIVDKGKDDALLYDANFVWRGHVRAWLSDDGLDDPVRAAVDGRGVAWIAENGARALRLVQDGRDGGRLGGSGKDPGEFGRIDDLAIDLDDHVYAVDSDRDRVQIFTPEGLLERIVRGFGDAAFEKPVLVAVDPGRRLTVFDRDLEALLAGDPDGSLAWRVSTSERIKAGDVADLEVDDRGTLYLLDRDGRRVIGFSRDGRALGEIVRPGDPVALDEPVAIANGPSGTLLVLDRGDRRLQELRIEYPTRAPAVPRAPRTHRATTGPATTWHPVAAAPGDGESAPRWLSVSGSGFDVRSPDGRPLATPEGLGRPRDRIVATGTGDGFVVVDRDDRIVRLDRDGRRLGTIDRRTGGGELEQPRAIAWRRDDGALAVYDEDGDDLLLLDTDGGFLQRIGRRGSGPGEIDDVRALGFDPSGRLWVVDQRGSRLQIFDRFGVLTPDAPGLSRIGAVADLGLDRWGRVYLLAEDTGIVTVLDDEGGPVCAGGDPARIDGPERLAVVGAVAWLRRERTEGEAIPVTCAGPPPAPADVRLALGGPAADRVVLRWSGDHPAVSSYVILRRRGEGWERIGETGSSEYAIPETMWATAPSELVIVGLDGEGREGPGSDPVLDRLTPALRALRDRVDEERAESWIAAAIEELPADDPAADALRIHRIRLRARIAAARGDHEGAIELLESELSALGEATVLSLQGEIVREALDQAVRARDGERALVWLERIEGSASAEPSPLEARALALARGGESDAAIRLLEAYGHHGRDLAGVPLERAVAEVRLELGRVVKAVEGFVDAARAADPGEQTELDRPLFQLAETAIDRLVHGGDAAAATVAPEGERGLRAEGSTGIPRVDAVLAALRRHAARLGELDREVWAMRIEALSWKPEIRRALELERASEFAAARELYESILVEKTSLLVADEIRIRSHLAVIALAQGDEPRAREQLSAALEADPSWDPNPEELGPSIRDLVERIRLGGDP